MIDPLAISINLILFIAVIVIFAKEKDYVAYSLLFALCAWVFTTQYFDLSVGEYISHVEFSPLIFIICSQIMISIAEEQKIFQYIAIKSLSITKARPRPFLYMISIISSLIAAITPDVMVSLIFIPLVIRIAKLLHLDPKPFMYAITINMNIGACLAPFNPTNYIIAVAFNKSPLWFFETVIGMYIVNMLVTTILLDVTFLRKQPPPDEHLRRIVMDFLDPNTLINGPQEKLRFYLNAGVFFTIIICFFIIPEMELVSLVGAIIMSLINRKDMEKSFEKVDWKIIFFLVGMFVMISTMEIAGTFELIGVGLVNVISDNAIVVAIFIVLIASLFSAFLDNTPVALMIIPILLNLFDIYPDLLLSSTPIIFGLIAAVNLGGNLLPQGAAGDLMTLSQAKKHGVTDFNYKTLTKTGGSFALIHIGITIIIILFMVLLGV